VKDEREKMKGERCYGYAVWLFKEKTSYANLFQPITTYPNL